MGVKGIVFKVWAVATVLQSATFCLSTHRQQQKPLGSAGQAPVILVEPIQFDPVESQQTGPRKADTPSQEASETSLEPQKGQQIFYVPPIQTSPIPAEETEQNEEAEIQQSNQTTPGTQGSPAGQSATQSNNTAQPNNTAQSNNIAQSNNTNGQEQTEDEKINIGQTYQYIPQQPLSCLDKCRVKGGISCKVWTKEKEPQDGELAGSEKVPLDHVITCCKFTGCQWPFSCEKNSFIQVQGCQNRP